MKPWMLAPYETMAGTTESLARYAGSAILVVNTASECGYTPQYAGLQELHEAYFDRGLMVVAFPSNDFGAQEPGTNGEIRTFCSARYRITFPVQAKVITRGPEQCRLYAALTGSGSPFAGDVLWNFEKFLLNRAGDFVARFRSDVEPSSSAVTMAIQQALGDPAATGR